MERQTTTGRQRIKVKGEELLAKVRQLIHEGNIRRITITDASDRTILEIPLTVGVVGAILAPALVAIGAIAALAKDYTLEIERHDATEAGATEAGATEAGATAQSPAEAGELVTTTT